MNKIKQIKKVFRTEKPIIGMIHFMPLMGYKGYKGIDAVLKKALNDLKALEGGVDGVIVENNYDTPHKISVSPETIACMTYLTKEIVKETKLPVGVAILWNDYKAALAIAKICGAKFIRVPVFVDNVKTNYGDVFANPDEVIKYRKTIGAGNIMLFTDIHVKHATLLSKFTLEESAQMAVKNNADAIIITGKWTADAPNIEDLRKVRASIGNFPILIGSGAIKDNIGFLMHFADGVIVGTSFKTGIKQKGNVNIKGYNEKIDKDKVKAFMRIVKQIRRTI